MTQEEKAMAYDEALEKARAMYGGIPTDNAMLEEIFPVLAESEDERIIRLLRELGSLDAAKELYEEFNLSYTDVLYWLEKQKDLDKMIVVFPEVWDKAISDAFENGKKEGVKQKEPHYTKRNALFDKCVENCDPKVMKSVSDEIDEMLENEQKPISQEDFDKAKHEALWGEQKPVERSLEDNRIIGFVYALLNRIKWKDNWAMSKEECLRRLKSLRPQSKVEWSDGDKYMFEKINGSLNGLKQYVNEHPSMSQAYKESGIKDIEQQQDWLKSLKPSWKPSEEEERLINTSISFLKDFADKGYENAVECIDWLKSKLNGNSGK